MQANIRRMQHCCTPSTKRASFSRALSEGLSAKQSADEFNGMLGGAIQSIFEASRT